jgi:hypothetical protein
MTVRVWKKEAPSFGSCCSGLNLTSNRNDLLPHTIANESSSFPNHTPTDPPLPILSTQAPTCSNEMAKPDAPPAPGRSERKLCWGARDRYFDCLDDVRVVEPGKEAVSQCAKEMLDYDRNCARSWVRRFSPCLVLLWIPWMA